MERQEMMDWLLDIMGEDYEKFETDFFFKSLPNRKSEFINKSTLMFSKMNDEEFKKTSDVLIKTITKK
jgi:hypothetical protein